MKEREREWDYINLLLLELSGEKLFLGLSSHGVRDEKKISEPKSKTHRKILTTEETLKSQLFPPIYTASFGPGLDSVNDFGIIY